MGIVQLVDIRHDPTKDDIMMMTGYSILIFLYGPGQKADKLPRQGKPQGEAKKSLNPHRDIPLILFSADSGQGRTRPKGYRKLLEGSKA